MDLLGLDRESILLIISFLDHASLCSLQLVCTELRLLCGSNLVWLPLMARRYGLKLQVGDWVGRGARKCASLYVIVCHTNSK